MKTTKWFIIAIIFFTSCNYDKDENASDNDNKEKWTQKELNKVLDRYPKEVYNQDSVKIIVKEFFSSPSQYESLVKSNSKVCEYFGQEIYNRARKEDDVVIEEEF